MEENKDIEIKNDVEETPKVITVKDWISHLEAEEKNYEVSFDGTGGFFKGERWDDYFMNLKPEFRPYAQALFNEFKEHDIVIFGESHVLNDLCTPLFSDNTVARCSMRGWADLTAACQAELCGEDFSYLDFMFE